MDKSCSFHKNTSIVRFKILVKLPVLVIGHIAVSIFKITQSLPFTSMAWHVC